MDTYKVQTLNDKTPKKDQDRLATALKAVHGVQEASLRLDSGEFQIRPRENQVPKREDILAASARAGFPVTANAKSKA